MKLSAYESPCNGGGGRTGRIIIKPTSSYVLKNLMGHWSDFGWSKWINIDRSNRSADPVLAGNVEVGDSVKVLIWRPPDSGNWNIRDEPTFVCFFFLSICPKKIRLAVCEGDQTDGGLKKVIYSLTFWRTSMTSRPKNWQWLCALSGCGCRLFGAHDASWLVSDFPTSEDYVFSHVGDKWWHSRVFSFFIFNATFFPKFLKFSFQSSPPRKKNHF